MSKFLGAILLIILSSFSVSAQKIKEKDIVKHRALAEEQDSAVLKMALQIKDYGVALNAAYRLTAKAPNDNENLLSLANIYYQAERYDQSLALCDKVLKNDTSNIEALQLMVANFTKNENKIGAQMGYQELFKITNEAKYLYQISELLFNNKEYQKSLNVLSKLVSDSTLIQSSIAIGFNQNNQPTQQSVEIKAAGYNLIGFIYFVNGQYGKASAYYQEAIKIQNDFQLAINNLKESEKARKQQVQPNSN